MIIDGYYCCRTNQCRGNNKHDKKCKKMLDTFQMKTLTQSAKWAIENAKNYSEYFTAELTPEQEKQILVAKFPELTIGEIETLWEAIQI